MVSVQVHKNPNIMKNILLVAELCKDEHSPKGEMARYILSIRNELNNIPDGHKSSYIIEGLKKLHPSLADRLRNANAWSEFLNEIISYNPRQ